MKIHEYDFIRSQSKGFTWLLKTIDKVYWGYGQRPKRLIYITIVTILLFGFLYSFFPEHFKHGTFNDIPYIFILYDTLYYSVQTFTTLSDSDISPTGIVKFLTVAEALFGVITMGFLVGGIAKSE